MSTETEKLKKEIGRLIELRSRMLALLKRCVDFEDIDFDGTIHEIRQIIREIEG